MGTNIKLILFLFIIYTITIFTRCNKDIICDPNSVYSCKLVEIPDHVDPPFRFMLTHHSGMLTHPLFDTFLKRLTEKFRNCLSVFPEN